MATTMKPVKSSSVHSVGYDPATRVLAVHFKGSDKVYHYQNVPQHMADEMHRAESIGNYIAKQIKPHFHHEVIETT